MKNSQLIILGILGLCVVVLMFVSGFVSGVSYTTINSTPEVLVETVEIPVVITQEVVVTKEVLVTPTPEPVVTVAVTESPVSYVPTEESCVDSAWVVSQPYSNINGGAIEEGRLKRLRFRIRNDGTCIWDGYVLASNGVLQDIPIPLTYPGEIADFYTDLPAYQDVEARFYLQPPVNLFGASQPLLVNNSASPGVGLETMYYKLEIKAPNYKYMCGPFGCRLNPNWRFK